MNYSNYRCHFKIKSQALHKIKAVDKNRETLFIISYIFSCHLSWIIWCFIKINSSMFTNELASWPVGFLNLFIFILCNHYVFNCVVSDCVSVWSIYTYLDQLQHKKNIDISLRCNILLGSYLLRHGASVVPRTRVLVVSRVWTCSSMSDLIGIWGFWGPGQFFITAYVTPFLRT